jgi:RNA polymerase sigma-70 factor (ECF subfamily)
MLTTSPSLLEHLRHADDPQAWGRFVRLYTPILYAWARRMRLQHADAVDLVQEVFTTLVQKLPEFQYDDRRRFRGWLWTVTRNKWREKCRQKVVPIDPACPPDEVAGREMITADEDDLRQHLLGQVLPEIREEFQPSTWTAFWEHAVRGRLASEVALELGLSEAAVYKAKMRVTVRLHREFADLLTD